MTAIVQSPSFAPIGRERRLSLETTGDADVLLRVLVLLRRRGFAVRACEFRASDRHAPARLDLCVESPMRAGSQLGAWLMNVVGVVGVAEQ
ncbi:ACT domain-containing protein [Candidatus Solirubrobacter pratensis]|uniref:ACT domain-containing protein n=1 Tax=Candidatus Solirubrobacter pratensis TaxID=1298857 RepID=UPI00041E10CC|nr:ACT domain-containing protein [Candidatus Solirubrobacter pratensis]